MTLGLGYSEILIIAVLALIVIGPRKLPEMMRNVGKIMGQLRRASDDIRREILFSDEINEVKRTVRETMDPTSPPPTPPKLKVKKRDTAGDESGPAEDVHPPIDAEKAAPEEPANE